MHQKNKRIARSKQENFLRVKTFRENLKDLRTSFQYILNLESRDTYSDPGTGFKISKSSIAPKAGIKALRTLINSSILKRKPFESSSSTSSPSVAAQLAANVHSSKFQILTPANSSDPESSNPFSHHLVQVEISRDDFNFETPSGEPSQV